MLYSLKSTTALATIAIIASFAAAPAHAQEISGANAVAPTVLIDNTAVTDTTQGGGNEWGQIDVNGGTFNVPSITTGTDDGVATNTHILIMDSVTGGDIVTVDGDFTINTGAVNPDTIQFKVGYSISSTLSAGVDFNGNIDAGNGAISIWALSATNPDTITFSGQTINLGTNGGIIFSNATDTATFDGSAAQTFTGDIIGISSAGLVNVDNAAGVTFVNGVGSISAYQIDAMTIAGSGTDSAATLMADSYLVSGITLGDGAGSDTNTLTLDTSNNDFTLYSDVTGTAGDTDNIVIQGGGTFTLDAGNDVDVDNITITGNGTIFDDQNDNAHTVMVNDTMTIGSGATLKLGNQAGVTVTNGITNNGTIQFADSSDILYAAVTGGHFDVDAFGSATDSNLNIDTMDIATGASFSFGNAATVTIGQTTLNGTAELGLGANDFTGNVVAATSGDGVVNVADLAATQTITGNIGEAGKTIGTFLIYDGGTNANLVQTTGNLYVDTITVGASDTLQLLGTSAQTVSGAVTGGTVTVGNGTSTSNVTFNSALASLAGFNVKDNASATLSNSFATTGNLSVDGNLTVAQGKNATVADVVAGSAQGNFYLTVGTSSGNDNSATLLDTGAALDFADLDGTNANTMTLSLKPGTGVVANGQEFLIIDGAATVANFTNGASIADSFALFDFTLSDGATATLGADDSDIVATASRVNIAAVTNTQTNADTLTSFLDSVTAADTAADAVLESVYNSVLANPDPDDAAESIQAAVDGGLIIAANNFAAANNNINNQQLAALRIGGGETGMAAGDGYTLTGARFWSQAFGKTATQDRRDSIDGFDLDTYGVAFGADKELDNDVTIGVAFSYGDTEVDSKNATTTNTEIDSYQLSLYGDYDLGNDVYVSGSAYYAYHDIQSTRHNVGGVSGLTAKGDFSANQYGMRAEVGRDYKRGESLITPKILTNISHYDADSYTETGAGGASLSVDTDAVDVVELGVGADAKWSLQQANGAVLQPVLSAEYRHDFIGDEVESNSSFTGTNASFQTKGFDPAQDTFSLGASVTYYAADNWEFTADYDYEFKQDYDSHSGFLKAAYKF